MKREECSNCQKAFTTENPPKKLKNCDHNICSLCLPTSLKCPIDNKRIQFRRFSAKGFQINQELLDEILQQENKTKIAKIDVKKIECDMKPQFQMCLLHSKVADLICCDDGTQICANCALFGQHKGHNIKNTEQFLQELSSFMEQALSSFEQLKEKQQNLSEQIVSSYIQDEFKQARSREAKNIKNKFTKLIQKIRKTEKSALASLDGYLNERKKVLKNQVNLKDIQGRKSQWYQEIQALGSVTQEAYSFRNFDIASKYLDGNSSQSFLLKRGEYLQLQYSTNQNMIKSKIDSEISNIQANFNESEIDNFLNNFCYFKKEVEKKEITPGKSMRSRGEHIDGMNDDILLETQNSPVKTYAKSSYNISSQEKISLKNSPDQEQENTISSFQVRINNCKITDSFSTYQSPIFTDEQSRRNRSNIKSQQNIQSTKSVLNSIDYNGKKKRKLDIPEKYRPIVQDLKNDKCEVIDFGGAELGDTNISILCQFIERTSKLRNLKLVRNKITDDGLKQLLSACFCAKVTSLNLGQNLLTQKSLEIIQQFHLGNLKNITLSLNKINRRNAKTMIEEISRRGITLSI